VQRYWAEAARTYVLGPAPQALRELAGRVGAAMAAMREAAVAGAQTGEIVRAAEEKLADAAIAASASPYGFAHGIGLDPEEAPLFATGGNGRLAEDCSLGLHLVAHSGQFGMALGQTVIARKGRSESLNDAATLIECRGV
jgi:Xaa-Pro aminopeptidase